MLLVECIYELDVVRTPFWLHSIMLLICVAGKEVVRFMQTYLATVSRVVDSTLAWVAIYVDYLCTVENAFRDGLRLPETDGGRTH